MISVRLLGGFELALPDHSAAIRVGPKQQALLAYLAMKQGEEVSRGRLAGLLWGEREEDRARHSLSQALTTIRAALGSAAPILRTSADGVQLAPEDVDLDVARFEAGAHSRHRTTLEQASQLYRGAFLEGVGISEQGFEEWMLSERYRLDELAADAFVRLLDLQILEQDVDAAIATARRLVAIAPLDEQAHARLIALYGAQGRPGMAEAHYARCAELLSNELDREPGEDLRAALDEARRHAQVASVRVQPKSKPTISSAVPSQRARGRQRLALMTAGSVGVALLLLAGSWVLLERSSSGDDANSYAAAPWELPAGPSIAVLPFENLSGDPEQAYFADGVTSDIITDLSKFSGLFVTASSASFRYRDRAVKVQDVARDLGVRYVLEGRVRRADERLRIDVGLIDATTGRQVWAERYERPTEDILAAQKEITRSIAARVGSGWGELQRAEFDRIAHLPTEDLQAYDFYLRGIALKRSKNKENNALARQMFEQAIEEDPNYARAMAECSLTYLNDVFNQWTDSPQEALRNAEDYARRAIDLDPSEPWGLVTLGVIYQLKGEPYKALPLFETAHALNPNDSDVMVALGYAMIRPGSAERGVKLLEQARLVNPYDPGALRYLPFAYFVTHRYQDALEALNKMTDRDEFPIYWLMKSAVHAELEQPDEADAAVAEALKLNPKITLRSERERQLALGLDPAYVEHLIEALRKAGLPEATTQ